jgi:hypothetical protein
MKVKVRGKRVSIKLDPSSAEDQAFGDAYMKMMREAYGYDKKEPVPSVPVAKPRKRTKRDG